jgi:hypothetical protein
MADGAACPSSPPRPPPPGPAVIARLVAPVSLFALSYLAAAAALRAGWVTLFVVSLLVSQTAAVVLFVLRPTRFRARMRTDAPCPLASAPRPSPRAERSRAWAITGALVEEARLARPAPASEPAGAADAAAASGEDGVMTFWALVDAQSQTAVELFRSRVDAEVALAEAVARDPRRSRLSVAALDLGTLSCGALERAGVAAGALAGPAGALERALALAPARARGRG